MRTPCDKQDMSDCLKHPIFPEIRTSYNLSSRPLRVVRLHTILKRARKQPGTEARHLTNQDALFCPKGV